jgi:hypothetical protein
VELKLCDTRTSLEVDETLRLISFFENPYGVGWTMHPSLLIDVISKGHHHRYKLHPIFYFFMGFHMVSLLKRMVLLKILYIHKFDELFLEIVVWSGSNLVLC